MTTIQTLTLLALAVALTGCQLVVDFDRSKIGDAAADSSVDSGAGDGSMDAMPDGMTDAMTDAMPDGMTDAMTDATMDAMTDAMSDGSTDAMTDAMSDSSTDGSMDATVDAMTDAATDSGTDTAPAMVCGNGIVEGTEACDDGNMDACGTCDATCATTQPINPAAGSITTPAVALLVDGETFTLDDGVNAATVFEFDTDATATGVAIDISALTTADEVRDALVMAINAVAATLDITAMAGASGVLSLGHDVAGAPGNVAILETVTDAGFVTAGMSGGVASDCVATVGCVSVDDCLSMSCTSMLCD